MVDGRAEAAVGILAGAVTALVHPAGIGKFVTVSQVKPQVGPLPTQSEGDGMF